MYLADLDLAKPLNAVVLRRAPFWKISVGSYWLISSGEGTGIGAHCWPDGHVLPLGPAGVSDLISGLAILNFLRKLTRHFQTCAYQDPPTLFPPSQVQKREPPSHESCRTPRLSGHGGRGAWHTPRMAGVRGAARGAHGRGVGCAWFCAPHSLPSRSDGKRGEFVDPAHLQSYATGYLDRVLTSLDTDIPQAEYTSGALTHTLLHGTQIFPTPPTLGPGRALPSTRSSRSRSTLSARVRSPTSPWSSWTPRASPSAISSTPVGWATSDTPTTHPTCATTHATLDLAG